MHELWLELCSGTSQWRFCLRRLPVISISTWCWMGYVTIHFNRTGDRLKHTFSTTHKNCDLTYVSILLMMGENDPNLLHAFFFFSFLFQNWDFTCVDSTHDGWKRPKSWRCIFIILKKNWDLTYVWIKRLDF